MDTATTGSPARRGRITSGRRPEGRPPQARLALAYDVATAGVSAGASTDEGAGISEGCGRHGRVFSKEETDGDTMNTRSPRIFSKGVSPKGGSTGALLETKCGGGESQAACLMSAEGRLRGLFLEVRDAAEIPRGRRAFQGAGRGCRRAGDGIPIPARMNLGLWPTQHRVRGLFTPAFEEGRRVDVGALADEEGDAFIRGQARQGTADSGFGAGASSVPDARDDS